MKIKPFELERYFAKYEFSAPYLLSSSDCESLTVLELLEHADEQDRKHWTDLKLSYTESGGNPEFIKEITKLYDTVEDKDVLACVPEEGIYISMRALLEHGDDVVCTFPSYQSLYEVARCQGANVKNWEVKYQDGWYFDVDDLEKIVDHNTKMIIVNFPHNPTGATVTKEQMFRVVDIAKKYDCILFIDEMYRYLEYDKTHRLPELFSNYDRVISLCGLSKSFSMPGVRLGWLITKNQQMMDKLKTYKDYTTICLSAPSEILGIMALKQKERILENNLALVKQNLAHVQAFFDKYQNFFEFGMPKGGPIGYVKVSSKVNLDELCQGLIKSGLMILPSKVYFHEVCAFRIGFGRKNLKECLEIFDRYLEENYK